MENSENKTKMKQQNKYQNWYWLPRLQITVAPINPSEFSKQGPEEEPTKSAREKMKVIWIMRKNILKISES